MIPQPTKPAAPMLFGDHLRGAMYPNGGSGMVANQAQPPGPGGMYSQLGSQLYAANPQPQAQPPSGGMFSQLGSQIYAANQQPHAQPAGPGDMYSQLGSQLFAANQQPARGGQAPMTSPGGYGTTAEQVATQAFNPPSGQRAPPAAIAPQRMATPMQQQEMRRPIGLQYAQGGPHQNNADSAFA